MNHVEILHHLDACEDAVKWAETQPDLAHAWGNCRRSDWMLWLLDHSDIDENDPRLRLMACDFAEAVLHLLPESEDRPYNTIEVARRFAKGKATEEELAAARDAAWDARDAAWAAARDAAWADQAVIIRKYFPYPPEIKVEP